MDAGYLNRALMRAGIPVDGVRMGDPNDRTTWVVFYAADATSQQRAAGETLRLSLVENDQDTQAADFDQRATFALANDKVLKAVGLALYTLMLGRAPTTQEQASLFALVKTIYKGL